MNLEIKNLTKFFDDKCIFNNFSYSFKQKGIYGLVGDSGIGKTTLLRMIASLDKNYQGQIIGGGIGNVSFAFQEYRLFPTLSAIDNVVYAISDTKNEAVLNKAREIMLNLGITDEDQKLIPEELSGGMKQRVSLARAFIKEAPILLLDEPTKELDERNAKAVIEGIRKAGNDRLVIIVSHNPEDLSNLDATIIKL